MAPLIVLVASFLLLLGLGRVGVRPLREWRTALRFAFALMFLFTAIAHFGPVRSSMIRMVPPSFPNPGLLVTITGVLEILGAIGLMIPATARAAAVCLILLMLAMFPANAYAAINQIEFMGRPAMALIPRAALQIFFIAGLIPIAMPFGFQRQRALSSRA